MRKQISVLDHHEDNSNVVCDCGKSMTPFSQCDCDSISVRMMTRCQTEVYHRSVSAVSTRENTPVENICIPSPLPLDQLELHSRENTILSNKIGDCETKRSLKDKENDSLSLVIPPTPNKGEVETGEEEDELDIDSSRTLPWWCVIIAWVLVALSTAGAAAFTILYSFQWGQEKSTAWLTNFLLSFFESVVLIQPIKVKCLCNNTFF